MRTSPLASVALVVALCLAASIDLRGQATKAAETDIDSAMLELTGVCSVDGARPKTSAAWDELLRARGMTKKDNAWEVKTADGMLRAFAFFRPTQTDYWFVFFPSTALAIPDSVLSHLLRMSTSAEVTGAHIEVGLPSSTERSMPPQAVIGKFITISLAGGYLLSSRTTITWKESSVR
jgi:hypothetical protein